MNYLARCFMTLLRWGLGCCAALLVLAALYVSLGRELVPLVAEYRLELEDRATAALGVPLRIGRLEGRWQGFAPQVLAHDVQLGEGAEGLSLERVQLVPDLLGSLLARDLRIAHLQVDGLQLHLQEDEQGQWQLQGWPRQENAPSPDIAVVLKKLQVLQRVSLVNSRIIVQPQDQEPLAFSYVDLSLRYGASRQRLDGRLLLPDGQPLALQLRTRMQPKRWREAEAELYLSLPQSDWASWLPERLSGAWQLSKLQAGGELWLNTQGLAVQSGALRLHAPQITAGYAEREPVTLDNLAFNAHFQQGADGLQAQLDSLALSHGEQRIGEVHLALQQQAAREEQVEHWQLTGDRLDLAAWAPLIQALAPMPEAAQQALVGLHPVGAVENIRLDYRPGLEGRERLQFAANLQRVGISAYHGVPAVENVSGSASGDLENGELRLNTENFALHLDHLFPEPWRYRHAQARLSWQWNEQGLTLASPYMRLEGDEGQLAGDMLIRLLRDPEAEDYMDLRVGLSDGDASYTEKYLPTRSPGMSKELSHWLKTAIRGGNVEEGYFQYQGSLNKGAANEARSISLFFRVNEAELAFQPGWPALREGRGDVLIEDDGVRVRLQSGRVQDSRVSAVNADIPLLHDGKPPRLKLDGQVASSLPDAIKLLQEAPIGTADIFAGWQGEGDLTGRLQLDIPLSKGQAPGVVVDFATEGASLQLAEPKLQLSRVQGAFRFDLARGLSAPDVRAQVFGRQVRGRISAEGRGQVRSLLDLNGQVEMETLKNWLGVPQQLPISGLLPYRLRLNLGGADSQLRVDSNLKGVAIDLPAPFAKASGEERYADWRMTLSGAERRYWLESPGLVSLALAAPPADLSAGRGELLVGGGTARLPTGQGLRVRGRLAELDWSAWQQVGARYKVEVDDDSQRLFKDAELFIERFRGFGGEFEQIKAGLAREGQGWALQLDSELAAGRIVLADAQGVPIRVDLEHVHLPAADPNKVKDPNAPDPLAEVDPASIPALDIRIAEVRRGDKVLGAWSLKARPAQQGVRFEEIDLDLQGLKIGGTAGWSGTPGNTRSWHKGRLHGEDLGKVLLAWDFAPSVTSESFRLDVDGNWPGSPAWLSLKRFSGVLDPSLRKGQLVEVQGSAQALRVFGLLNFNSIGRRLRLDFSDLLGKGLSYDRLKGNLQATEGVFVTREPITLTGPSSNLELDGRMDMRNEQIDAKLLVTLPVTNNLPLAALIVGAPAIGGALFVVDKLLGDKVARFASVQYDVKGSLQNPEITFDKPFEKPQ